MKTILVATDFSDIAKNAIDYAAHLAKLFNAKLVLFHAYHDPIYLAEIPVLPPIDELDKDCFDSLKKIEKSIHEKYGKEIQIECVCKNGLPVDEINLFSKENKVDMVVMGMEGTSYLSEKMIGNITTSLIKKSSCPVLAIDKKVKFKEIKNIVLACDYKELENKAVLNPMLEFASIFGAKVFILNIIKELEAVTTISKAMEGIKINHSLEGVNHSFHYSQNEDVVDGINQFVDEHKIDMVVMIPRVHSLLYNLFHESQVKQMAFHTKVPLLALHN